MQNYCLCLTDELQYIIQHKGSSALQGGRLEIVSDNTPAMGVLEITGYWKINKTEYKIFYCRGKFHPGLCLTIERIFITPHLRRLGIGSAILRALAEIGRSEGVKALSVIPSSYHQPANRALDELLGPEPDDEIDAAAFYGYVGFVPIEGEDNLYVLLI